MLTKQQQILFQTPTSLPLLSTYSNNLLSESLAQQQLLMGKQQQAVVEDAQNMKQLS